MFENRAMCTLMLHVVYPPGCDIDCIEIPKLPVDRVLADKYQLADINWAVKQKGKKEMTRIRS
jgi:hypothetical protein